MAGDFSDDEWDIDDDQLTALEHNAILSTQQQQEVDRNANTHAKLPRNNVSAGSTERLTSVDLRRVAAQGARASPTSSPFVLVDEEDSFDNPQLDEDGVPLVVEEQPQPYRAQVTRQNDETTQRERWRQSRYAQKHGPRSHYQARPPSIAVPRQAYQNYQQTHQGYQPSQHGREARGQSQAAAQPASVPASPRQIPNDEALQAELQALRQEKESLAKNLNNVTTQLNTARGEISVVRNKNANDLKAAERQLSILRKQMQEEAAKHQSSLQSKDSAYGQLVTDSNFLKHELDEQTRKVQALQRQAREIPLQDRPNDVNLSPRKGLANTLRDGFDDDEVMLSPGRSPAKRRASKPNTPTKKRKQPTNDNFAMPALPLRLSGRQQHDVPSPQIEDNQVTWVDPDVSTRIIKDHETEEHLEFIQNVLSFCPTQGRDTVVEALVKFAFPTEPSRPLSSILLMQISTLKGKRLPADLLDIFARMLHRCASERYYKPTSLLLEVVNHILDADPTIIDDGTIQHLCEPIQSLANQNAAVYYLLADRTKIKNNDTPRPKPNLDINSIACINTLVTMAYLVVDEPDLIAKFWQFMKTDVILILLMPSQPLAVVHLTLDLVSTSVLEKTFGLITSPEDLQSITETYMVDKLSVLLFDPPRYNIKSQFDKVKSIMSIRDRLKLMSLKNDSDVEEPQPTRLEICQLRLHVLEVLTKFVMTSVPHPRSKHIQQHHGTSFVVDHPKCIARLVRNLYDEVSNLYACHFDTCTLHAQLVNRGTTLLHHILTSPQALAPTFDLTKALSGTIVGTHKFRVVMTRIALGDTLEYGLEPGITEDSRDMAREILNHYSTPEEADMLASAMGIENDDESQDQQMDVDDDAAEAEVMAAMEQ